MKNPNMNIVIVSDAWYPQINGVVHTLARTRDELVRLGHHVEVIGPDAFRTVPCPTYPEIRLSLFRDASYASCSNRRSPMQCISPPRVRWGWRRGRGA